MSIVQEIFDLVFDNGIIVKGETGVSGGCISLTQKITTDKGNYFLKTNGLDMLHMFETEEKGLNLLRNKSLFVPKVFGVGTHHNNSFILMEWVEKAPPQHDFWQNFGKGLAELHSYHDGYYGLPFDNYIGSLPQYNNKSDDWIDFFINQRILRQVEMSSGLPSTVISQIDALMAKLPNLLVDYGPSLLHGDLWSGNFVTGSDGYASIIDPAVYYGNREIEIAFTRIFGGFDDRFYEAYMDSFRLEEGYLDRFDIYNLYPLLVHYNLFGGSYLGSVQSVLNEYV